MPSETHLGDDAAEPSAPQLELLDLDPNEVHIAPNVRDNVDTTSPDFAALVASIRENGVLQPVSAIRDADGTITVVRGQQRVLAAREAGARLLAVAAPGNTGNDKQREFDRLAGQIDENDHRKPITDGQRAAAVAEMLDLRIPQAKVAKRLQLKTKEVKRLATIGRSHTARAALDSQQLDMEQALIIAAFDGEGDTDAVDQLLHAPAWAFRNRAALLLTQREESRARAAAAVPWAERGFAILGTEPTADEDWVHMDQLQHTTTGEPVTTHDAEAEPGRWAVYLTRIEGGHVVVTDTGEVISPELVDKHTEGTSPDTQPADGMFHADAVTVSDAWTPDYYISDPKASGLQRVPPARPDSTTGEQPPAPAAEEAEKRERERAERRRVIMMNRLGAAAKQTRIEWLTTYMTRKTANPAAVRFMAASLASDPGLLDHHRAKATAATILDIDVSKLTRDAAGEYVSALAPGRATMLVLALVLGALEGRCEKDCWKPNPFSTNATPGYLQFLSDSGYPLAPVEQVAAGDLSVSSLDADGNTSDDGAAEAGPAEISSEDSAA